MIRKLLILMSVLIPSLVFANGLAKADPFPVSIMIRGNSSVRAIPPLFYGQNIEWTSSGDGLWDAQGNEPVSGVATLLKPLHIGLIRFPGGSLTNCYHWEWGIGAKDQRKPNMVWFSASPMALNGVWTLRKGETEPSLYGFDEHMRFVRDVGAKGALITVNATYFPGSPLWGGSPQEAAAWVAYANARVNGPDVRIGTDYRGVNYHTSRYWARLRAENGHPAPYKCLYWEIGNEVNDVGQGAGVTGKEYAERVHQYAIAMHAVDPSVKIGAVLGFEWLKDILTIAGKDIGFLIYHFYGPGSDMQGATFWSNGSRTVNFTVPGGPCQLVFLASGTPAEGVWPNLQVSVDHKVVANLSVSADQKKGQVHNYFVPLNLPAGDHQLTFGFTNDLMTKTEDRNLFVSGVSLQKADGSRVPIELLSPAAEMRLLASEPESFDARFGDIDKAIHAYAPALHRKIQVFVTEFNAMYGMTDISAKSLLELKSALMVDGILQRALMEPRCTETNYWCLNSWYFQILHPGANGAYLTASGDIYRLFQPLIHGHLLQTEVRGRNFAAEPGGSPIPIPVVSAVTVRDGGRIAVNVVNYDPNSSASISVRISGIHGLKALNGMVCTGASMDSSNSESQPYEVRVDPLISTVKNGKAVFSLPAHSAGTVVLSVR
jgi:alpha-L-arabinofuranosidase